MTIDAKMDADMNNYDDYDKDYCIFNVTGRKKCKKVNETVNQPWIKLTD